MNENENALNHVDDVINTYPDLIKGIFAVKGMGQQKGSIVSRMSIDAVPEHYANKLRLLFMNLVATTQKIGQKNMDKIVFEFDNYYLILKKKFKTKAGAPIFLSLLTTKIEELDTIDLLFDQLSLEVFL